MDGGGSESNCEEEMDRDPEVFVCSGDSLAPLGDRGTPGGVTRSLAPRAARFSRYVLQALSSFGPRVRKQTSFFLASSFSTTRSPVRRLNPHSRAIVLNETQHAPSASACVARTKSTSRSRALLLRSARMTSPAALCHRKNASVFSFIVHLAKARAPWTGAVSEAGARPSAVRARMRGQKFGQLEGRKSRAEIRHQRRERAAEQHELAPFELGGDVGNGDASQVGQRSLQQVRCSSHSRVDGVAAPFRFDEPRPFH